MVSFESVLRLWRACNTMNDLNDAHIRRLYERNNNDNSQILIVPESVNHEWVPVAPKCEAVEVNTIRGP